MKTQHGMGLGGWLTVVMVAAKVFGFATYSWWFAFLPVWVALGIIVGVIAIAALFAILKTVLSK